MSSSPGIRVDGLSKNFRRYASPRHRLIEWLTLGNTKRHTVHTALHPLDFSVTAGESLGIIGENGAGKSTVLKLISGVLYPNSGSVEVTGRVVSLLELGAGFHPELDGISNIFESARLLGYSREEIESKLEDILAFAELGEFVHQPVRTLSSGMYVRLAFSLFAHLDPEVYIVDEALAVGDVFFQQKCLAFLETLKDRGVVVIFASHDMAAILRLCDRVLYLEHGQAVMLGDPVAAVNRYHASHDASRQSNTPVIAEETRYEVSGLQIPADARLGIENHQPRNGDRSVEILGARFIDSSGAPCSHVESKQIATLEIYAVAHSQIDDLNFGIKIIDRLNTLVFAQSILQKDRSTLTARKGEAFKIDFEIEFALAEGQYVFEVYARDSRADSGVFYDQLSRVRMLTVDPAKHRTYHGMIGMQAEYTVSRFGA